MGSERIENLMDSADIIKQLAYLKSFHKRELEDPPEYIDDFIISLPEENQAV